MLHFYRLIDKSFEYCFNIETSSKLTLEEIKILRWLLSETFESQHFNTDSFLGKIINAKKTIIEFGPRLNFETAYSTNAVAVCHSCGLRKIVRLERSRRCLLDKMDDIDGFIKENHDRMTEFVYKNRLETFETGIVPADTYTIPLLKKGYQPLKDLNMEAGLGFDSWDIDFYFNLFTKDIKRNPTNVELYQLSQANSEHSRHWFFKGNLTIDGKNTGYNLIELVKSTLEENPSNSIIAFSDNSSAITGFDIKTIKPSRPGFCSRFEECIKKYHIIFTAETHNFPSGVAPFPGAETGTGGRIRDVQATGRGGLVIAGTAGYATGNLNLPDYEIPGERNDLEYPGNLAAPLKIMIEESNGASDYGNKFGEPLIQGFTRTFGQVLPDNERKEWIKPIMFTGGVGQMDDMHVNKFIPQKGMLILQVGGPAYRIGMGGGSASSLIQGENKEELDFNAVQRGNAEMEQKLNRVVRACVEMGSDNPILSIHDQGAGGPCNVITEIVSPAGGKIDIRKINVGDRTMSVLEIWVCEYQERDAFLIYPENLDKFFRICNREKVNCEVIGEITGDGRIIVYDSLNDSVHVDLEISKILENIPRKTFKLNKVDKKLKSLEVPGNLSLQKAVQMVFKLPSVGSKGFLVRKVDRSVTGLVARQQCCGPLQLPVSDVAVIAQSHFDVTGAAISIGEQPLKIMVNSRSGARMSVAEALTNIMWAKLTGLSHIKCSVNWMWPAKLPGEGADIVSAAEAACALMKKLGIAADGGKDSVSTAAQVGTKIVKSPGELVISAYCTVKDITKVVTPDIKKPSKSRLILIDLSGGNSRLGGSAFAQCLGQLGDECPDVEDSESLINVFKSVQQLIEKRLILAGHDISDGGIITTISEMIMAGNCGAEINLDKIKADSKKNTVNNFQSSFIEKLFSEESGIIIEYLDEYEDQVFKILQKFRLDAEIIGTTLSEKKLSIKYNNRTVETINTDDLLLWWESTSDELEKYQQNPDYALQERKNHIRENPVYHLSFNPDRIPIFNIDRPGMKIKEHHIKPKVAIIREEGSNGDREMSSAFYMAGFETWDVTITDLAEGTAILDDFNGAVFVGGFSYADVLDSAKGWAGIIKFNPKLSDMFYRFFKRNDSFSLGVCNGCQLLSLLGWVPWPDIEQQIQPRFIKNPSGRFESRWVNLKILKSPSIMLKGMEGSILGSWIAHGEGYLHFPDKKIYEKVLKMDLAPLAYVDNKGQPTEDYPYNPNSSPGGITALCSTDGRHLAMMPHPERAFLLWQWPWIPDDFEEKYPETAGFADKFSRTCDKKSFSNKGTGPYGKIKASPWLQMFINARKWCEKV